MTLYRVGARLGNFADRGSLILAEIGYAVDTRTFFVGDDTATPPAIMTDKSTMAFDFASVPSVKFKQIDVYDGGKVDGVDLSTMNDSFGFPARVDNGIFINRYFETDEYIQVDNSDGKEGNPVIRFSEYAIQLLNSGGSSGGGNVWFHHGDEPPEEPLPGWFFWSTADDLLYVYTTDGNSFAWVDVAGTGGRGSLNANRTYIGDQPPASAFVGDKYVDSTDEYRIYLRVMDQNGTHWREMLSDKY